jgi:hypothetical protein
VWRVWQHIMNSCVHACSVYYSAWWYLTEMFDRRHWSVAERFVGNYVDRPSFCNVIWTFVLLFYSFDSPCILKQGRKNPQSITFRTGSEEDGIWSRYLSSKSAQHFRSKLSVHSTHSAASCRPSRRWSIPILFTNKSLRFTCRFPGNQSLYNCKAAHVQLMIPRIH